MAKKKRILVVDDDPQVRESLHAALEGAGYEVLTCDNGIDGLANAEIRHPDLLLLDLMMPRRGGYAVLERLRDNRPENLRIVVITASRGTRHEVLTEMLGAHETLRKPFTMAELLECVGRHLPA